jgi:hypothetical protein
MIDKKVYLGLCDNLPKTKSDPFEVSTVYTVKYSIE